MRTSLLFLLAASTLGLFVAGCFGGDSQGPGRVAVTWQVSGSTCKKAGLVDVRVDLLQEGEKILGDGARCSDGTLLFDDVPVGVYDIRVRGLDEENNVKYEGSFEALSVKEGNTPSAPPEPVELRAKKGTILLRWSFPQGESSLCSFNNVDEIEVNVYQAGTVLDLFTGIFPCDPAYGDPADLPAPFEDGWLVLSDMPPGELDIFLLALSPEDERIYFGEETVMMANSGDVQVTVHFQACNGECI